MNEAFQEETEQYVEEMKAGANSILVTVRIRPLNSKERSASIFQTISVLDSKLIVLNQPEAEGTDFLRKNRLKENKFAFDFVFDRGVGTREIYESTVEGLLEGVLEGYHSTVLAYGPTSCGKTYTMVGQGDKQPGIMAYTVLDLLNRIHQLSSQRDIKLKASYIEIYNENIKDLLITDDRNFDLREDPKEGVLIPGVTEVSIENISQLKTVLKVGCRNRTKQNTYMNEASSRSHAILQLHVEAMDKNPSVQELISVSKFSLVDLAGSERGGALWNNNQRIVEGTKINQSLLVLGNCIQALSQATEKGTKNAFIPYRGSKLTRLLKDALGGNCRTIMISHVSPAASSFEETYNTLIYANRAKGIKNNAVRNNLVAELHVSNYANVIKNLKRENQDLKNQLKKQRNRLSPQRLPPVDSQRHEQQVKRYQKRIDEHFQEEQNLIKEIAQLGKKIEILAFRIFAYQLKNKNTETISKEAGSMSSSKIKLEEKLAGLSEKRQAMIQDIKNNEVIGKIGISSLINLVTEKKVSVQMLALKMKEEALREEKEMMKGIIQVVKKRTSGEQEPRYYPDKLLLKKNNIISRLTFSQVEAAQSLDVTPITKKQEQGSKRKQKLSPTNQKQGKYSETRLKPSLDEKNNLSHDYVVQKRKSNSPSHQMNQRARNSPKSGLLRNFSNRKAKVSEDTQPRNSEPKHLILLNRANSGKIKKNMFDFIFLPH